MNPASPKQTNKFYSQAKVVKLRVHPRTFSAEDLVVNFDAFAREKFQLFEGTVLEILPTGEKDNVDQRIHLLLEVKSLPPEIQAKGTPISISNEVAQAFKLTGLREVCVRRVDKQSVGLDLMELRFKDQALGRSDLWRFTNSLIGKGIFRDRRLEFAGMRMTVSNLWSRGERVRSGAVVDTTRVVFRSASARFFLFLQISSEMWEFDPNGDLYFNKAVDGFLSELFSRWKEQKCNHDVTLVLFARRFFTGHGCPSSSMLAVQSDKEGRFYHDLYKVIIDGETRKDWSSAIIEVKRGFLKFQKLLATPMTSSGEGDGENDEKAKWCVSPATNGNILEVVNLSINMFEQHYIDCSFHSTGHQVVIISPGVGVFEVDQEFSRLTQEKTIDQGVGLDLVCLNEQPLHAVPLFKFCGCESLQQEQYEIPHWINYSYYNPPQPWTCFLPRIKIPDYRINTHLGVPGFSQSLQSSVFCNRKFLNRLSRLGRDSAEAVIDYDKYDADIFSFSDSKWPSHETASRQRRLRSYDNATELPGSLDESILKPQATSLSEDVWEDAVDEPANKKSIKIRKRNSVSLTASLGGGHRHHSEELQPQFLHEQDLFSPPTATAVLKSVSAAAMYDRRHSNEGVVKTSKATINPFNPSKALVEMNSHQCRWMHTFPHDKVGRAFQTHHLRKPGLEKLDENQTLDIVQGGHGKSSSSLPSDKNESELEKSKGNSWTVMDDSLSENIPCRSKVMENFGLVRRKGMDWPSLSEPACLPITTDYFPDDSTLNKNYSETPGQLVASKISAGSGPWKPTSSWRADHQNMNTYQIFREMISLRLSQGFQLVFDSGNMFSLLRALGEMEDQLTGRARKKKKLKNKKIVTKFTLGRVFHKIELDNLNLFTNIYKLINPIDLKKFPYSYFLVTDGEEGISLAQQTSCTFTHTKMENYNWNYLDQHVCGFPEFEELHESHRYWRSRFLLLPSSPPPSSSCRDEWRQWRDRFTNSFIRLLEFLNHIKRTTPLQTSLKNEQRNLSVQYPIGTWQFPSPSPSPSPASTPQRSLSIEDGSEDRQFSSHSPTRWMTDGPHTRRKLGKSSQHSSRSREDLTAVDEEGTKEMVMERRANTPTSYKSTQLLRTKRSSTRRTSQDTGQEMRFTSQQHQQTWRRLKLDSASEYPDDQDTRRHGSGEAEGVMTTTLNIVPPSPSTPIPLTPTSSCNPQHPLKPLEGEESDPLTILSSPRRILAALLNKWEGVDVLGPQSGLRAGCFVGSEAVRCLTQKMVDNPRRRDVVRLLQKMITSGHIIHASGNRNIQFIDGYYLYRVVEYSTADVPASQTKEPFDMDWESYCKSWFEVAIHHPVLDGEEEGQAESVPQANSLNDAQSDSSFYNSTLPYYMQFGDRDSMSALSEISARYVELNPDLQAISNRPEWFYVFYSPDYHPMKAYTMEFQWMAATISILYKLIQSWSHKAAMCEFNLVPVPLIGYPNPKGCERPHPFRYPLFVALKIPAGYHQFVNCPAGDRILSKLVVTILNKFGFLEDPCPSSDLSLEQSGSGSSPLSSGIYIHYTGCAMIQPTNSPLPHWEEGLASKERSQSLDGTLYHRLPPSPGEGSDMGGCGVPCYGFHWYWNHFYLRQRNTQANLAEKHQKLLEEFTHYCSSDSVMLPFACSQLLEQTKAPPTVTSDSTHNTKL